MTKGEERNMKTKRKSEFERFDSTMRALLSVPHDEIKAKLDEEEASKKRTKSKKSSAFREASAPA